MERRKPHKNLELWGKTIDLVSYVYEISKSFPREEEYGLKAQVRRAAISVPSPPEADPPLAENISEGLTRKTSKDRSHFLNMAQGSLSEIDAQIEIARRLTYISEAVEVETNNRLAVVERLLSGLIRSIKERQS